MLFSRVGAVRSATGPFFGDKDNPPLLHRMRQPGNFVGWTGFVLILMILAEGMGAPDIYLHITGTLLLISRLAYPFGLRADTTDHPRRYVGIGTNILATLKEMVCLALNIPMR